MAKEPKKTALTTSVYIRLPSEVHRAVRHVAIDAGKPLGTVIAELLVLGLAAKKEDPR